MRPIVQSFLPNLQAWYSNVRSKAEDIFILIEEEDKDLASMIYFYLMDIISCFDVLEMYCAENPHTGRYAYKHY